MTTAAIVGVSKIYERTSFVRMMSFYMFYGIILPHDIQCIKKILRRSFVMITKEKEWIKNPKNESKLKATLGSDGKLRISETLFEKLPEYVRFNFDVKSRFLYIAKGIKGNGDSYKKHKTMTIHGLSFNVVKENISLPIRFNFKLDSKESYWIGKIDISKNDFEKQITICKGLIDYLVYTQARSTPCEDRRQSAIMAFFEATKCHNDSYGDFYEFARWFMIKRMKEGNKAYSKARGVLSLDESRKNGKGDSWCLYDKLGDNSDVALNAIENITIESLRTDLEEKSVLLTKMLIQGYTSSEISEALDMSDEDIYRLAEMTGERRGINHRKNIL